MLSEYLAGLSGEKISVVGAGVSNTPLIRLLCDTGFDITVYDKDPALCADLISRRVKTVCGEHYLDEVAGSLIFRTPGVHPNSPALVAARARGARVTSEMDVFFSLCPCKTIAVTGSDGKTTTSSLIAELLRKQGFKVWLGGNIGAPLLPELDKIAASDRAVIELSSFQLMDMTHSPDVAVITNITPNHLDYHGTMDEYVRAKANILAHQGQNSLAVLNYGSETTRALVEKAHGRVCFFSSYPRDDGFSLDCGIIKQDGAFFADSSILRIPGRHNIENFMAAAAAVCDDVSAENIRAAADFRGVAHRIEFVRELDGVRYFNDSIGTTPTRTEAGLSCFDGPVVLIAGGYDKHIPFDDFGKTVAQRVKLLLLCGATADKIEAAVRAAGGKTPQILRFENLKDTIAAARAHAVPGDTVLLSPACAAFDQFKNFAVRGEFFKKEVNDFR